MKIRTVKDTEKIEPLRLPRIGSEVTIIAVTNKGRYLKQPARVISTHTPYIVVRAIPDEGGPAAEERMALQTFSKATHHRVRHDGTTSASEWLDIDDAPPQPTFSNSRAKRKKSMPIHSTNED